MRAGLVSLTVAPVVDASVKAGAVSGTVRPPLPGAAVQLQRQRGTLVGDRRDRDARHRGLVRRPARRSRPGSYRVRWAPGGGLAPGVSQLLAVP